MTRRKYPFAAGAALLAGVLGLGLPPVPVPLHAEDRPARAPVGIFGIYSENDLFAGTDRWYTNGLRLAWISPEAGEGAGRMRLPRWLDGLGRALSPPRSSGSARFVSIHLDQSMYTPEEIGRSQPDPRDEPYAGHLYAGLGFHSRDERSLDSVELGAGVVGPASLAGGLQKLWHRTFGWEEPRGWSHQLKDEAVLALAVDHREKIVPADGSGFSREVILHGGAALSNAFTGADAGMELRLGWNLPKDFGSSRIRPVGGSSYFENRGGPGDCGFHFFLDVGGRAVVRDIFLDGNTFIPGPSVGKLPFVAEAEAGFAVRLKRFVFSAGYVFQSRLFATQRRTPIYGTFLLTYRPGS